MLVLIYMHRVCCCMSKTMNMHNLLAHAWIILYIVLVHTLWFYIMLVSFPMSCIAIM